MPWTFDQWTHLLAVLAWPTVAMIAGTAWIHGCRLLLESVDAIASAMVRCLNDNSGKWSRVALQGLARWAQAQPPMNTRYVDPQAAQVEATCERALLAVLAARGGFPARQNEAPGRSLVREVREMYAEIQSPTPRPEPAAESHVPGMTDLMASPESLDEYLADDLYAQFTATDEDAADHVETETADLEDL